MTITGSGFTASVAGNQVTVGGVGCIVTAATTTEIKCKIGKSPAGDQKVEVNVLGCGLAGGSVTLSMTLSVSAVDPKTACSNGGK